MTLPRAEAVLNVRPLTMVAAATLNGQELDALPPTVT
jgi:hypothetical protein